MKYKVGDKVRVRKDLKHGNSYGGTVYVSNMDKFKNEECVITSIDNKTYNINGSGYWWTDEMLEPVDDLLEYALEKLEMTKEELENEMINSQQDTQDTQDAKELAILSNNFDAYCKSFGALCNGCEVRKFKNKYRRIGKMNCCLVFKYLSEREQI